MYPIGTPQGIPSRPGDQNAHFPTCDEVAKNPPIHVLSVGRIEPGTVIRDALLDARDFRVSFVHDYRDLWISSKQHDVHAVVFHNSLCAFELAEGARLTRSRWPNAKILVIRSGEMSLDHTLYDQRLHSPVREEVLIEQIVSLTHSLQEGVSRGNH